MKKVIIPKPINESLVASLESLYYALKNLDDNERVHFDLSQIQWAHPLIILPLAVYIQSTGSEFIISNKNLRSYLNRINFPNGLDSVSLVEEILQQNKSYVPISVLKKDAGFGRERLESQFSHLVLRTLNATKVMGVSSAVFYPISELVTNIAEHSRAERGFIFGQFYPKKKYLDICIVDRGRGLSSTYREDAIMIFSDSEAIIEVMGGHSTKANKERGYGVRTSKKVICSAMGGEFVLLSGSAAFVADGNNKEKLGILPGFNWQGVIVSYRIPQPYAPIDITLYLE